MKRTFLLKTMLLLCALVAGSSSVWGTDATLELSSSNKFGTSTGSTLNDDKGNTWTCVGSNIQNTYSTDYSGQQFGTSKTNNTYTFTANFAGKTVTNVSIIAAAGSTTPTYDISVGGLSKKSGSLSQTATEYSTGTISGTGNVVVTLNQNNAKKAVYLGKIVVTYAISDNPSIAVKPSSSTILYDTEEGTLAVTYNKIAASGKEVLFYKSDGTTSTTYSWFDADINGDGNVEYVLEENTDTENDRTAYFKVHGKSTDDDSDVYSDLISITQSKSIVDYATLPFDFDGGKSQLPTGMTQDGLGSDYSSSPKLKFDNQGDYLILKIKGTLPKELSFNIKGNSLSGTLAFDVQWSVNGIDYNNLESYSTISTFDGKKTIDISSCDGLRYIKWVYTTKGSGNVGLGNIKVTPQTVAFTMNQYEWSTLVSDKALDFEGSDVKAYVVTGHNGNALEKTEVTTVAANTPLLLNAAAGNHEIPVAASGTAYTDNKLKAGTDAEVAAEAGKTRYVLSLDADDKIAFMKINTDAATVPADKAYLEFNEVVSAPSFGFGDATAIDDVRSKTEDVRGDFYNLNGQRVINPTKGLYIVNGKKYIVK